MRTDTRHQYALMASVDNASSGMVSAADGEWRRSRGVRHEGAFSINDHVYELLES
jgi:hypothetical protein